MIIDEICFNPKAFWISSDKEYTNNNVGIDDKALPNCSFNWSKVIRDWFLEKTTPSRIGIKCKIG